MLADGVKEMKQRILNVCSSMIVVSEHSVIFILLLFALR